LIICVLSQQDTYDLRSGSFRDGWQHFLRKIRTEKPITRTTKCTECQLKAMCGMCPANGELENGDPESPVSFLCHVAHLRAHAFGLPIPPHGDCEYCEGGSAHDALMASVAGLSRSRSATAARTPMVLPLMPVTGGRAQSGEASCGSGGCRSCQV
jgi:radical SAM protein with 4Fe4S-binding SPASM domain